MVELAVMAMMIMKITYQVWLMCGHIGYVGLYLNIFSRRKAFMDEPLLKL